MNLLLLYQSIVVPLLLFLILISLKRKKYSYEFINKIDPNHLNTELLKLTEQGKEVVSLQYKDMGYYQILCKSRI